LRLIDLQTDVDVVAAIQSLVGSILHLVCFGSKADITAPIALGPLRNETSPPTLASLDNSAQPAARVTTWILMLPASPQLGRLPGHS
jgi:hypothetical protein